MTKTLHAIFDGKVLRPEEPVDLKPNTRYLVTIDREVKPVSNTSTLWDVLDELAGTVRVPFD